MLEAAKQRSCNLGVIGFRVQMVQGLEDLDGVGALACGWGVGRRQGAVEEGGRPRGHQDVRRGTALVRHRLVTVARH